MCVQNERSIPVAVKILNKNNADAKKSLLQEAALMGQFNHINVVRLVGVVTRADPVRTPCVVCESFPYHLKQNMGSLSMLATINWIGAVCCFLSHGIVIWVISS